MISYQQVTPTQCTFANFQLSQMQLILASSGQRAGDAAEQLTMHRTVSYNKGLSSLNVNRAEVGTPCCRIIELFPGSEFALLGNNVTLPWVVMTASIDLSSFRASCQPVTGPGIAGGPIS